MRRIDQDPAARCGAHGPIPHAAGIGLRFPHHRALVERRPGVAWIEVHPENYMGGGPSVAALEAARALYPVALHGVGMSIGSAEAIDGAHLERLAALADRIAPGLVSEHLSWSVASGTYLADLLPLPLTDEALDVVCRNVGRVQDRLKRTILIENPSTYLEFGHSTIPESEFLAALARRSGCGILCDVNNIYVSACNHGWDAAAYLAALPADAIGEIHLAGHAVREIDGATLRIDDHGSCVAPEVWTLYEAALARFGRVPTLIEWDTAIPPLDVLIDEAAKAQARLDYAKERSDAQAA